MDMPATQQGADIYPQRTQALDLNSYSRRIKQFGAALRTGDSVMITKVRVKEKVIEFQLGGGGYGTLGDDTMNRYLLVKETRAGARKIWKPRSGRKLIRRRRSGSGGNWTMRGISASAKTSATECWLQKLPKPRNRESAMKRLQGGSRFNIRYEPRVPAEVLTPEAVSRRADAIPCVCS